LSSPTRPQWEHRCSHHSRCIRMPCEHIPILSTWESRQGELLQTIAAHWKYQKQKAKKQVATNLTKDLPRLFLRVNTVAHGMSKTILSFQVLGIDHHDIFLLPRRANLYPPTSTCNKTPAIWLLSVTQTRHNAALSKVPWSGTGSTWTWTVSKPNTSNTRHSVGRIDHMISYDSFAVLHVGQKSIRQAECPGSMILTSCLTPKSAQQLNWPQVATGFVFGTYIFWPTPNSATEWLNRQFIPTIGVQMRI